LEDGPSAGDGVDARATPAHRDARARRQRHRRDGHPQRAYLPHRGQRLAPWAADLVWRHRSLRGQHGLVLPGGWAPSKPRESGWRCWTCGRRFAPPPSRLGTRRRPAFSTTSSIFSNT
jgi:hypothetical protein